MLALHPVTEGTLVTLVRLDFCARLCLRIDESTEPRRVCRLLRHLPFPLGFLFFSARPSPQRLSLCLLSSLFSVLKDSCHQGWPHPQHDHRPKKLPTSASWKLRRPLSIGSWGTLSQGPFSCRTRKENWGVCILRYSWDCGLDQSLVNRDSSSALVGLHHTWGRRHCCHMSSPGLSPTML